METYAKYLAEIDGSDIDICSVMNDELHHAQELYEAMNIIDPDHLTVREENRKPFPPDISDLSSVKLVSSVEQQ